MSATAMRKVIQRGAYRERAQPKARAHLGLLEKHKDYKIRAVNYHQKEREIQRLREAARLRNPDEFNFRMKSEQTTNGVHVLKRDDTNTPHRGDVPDYVRNPKLLAHMQDQDLAYLVTQQQHEDRVIARLRTSLHCLADAPTSGTALSSYSSSSSSSSSSSTGASTNVSTKQHVVFTDTVADAKSFRPAKYFNTAPDLVQRVHNRLTTDQLQSSSVIASASGNHASLVRAEKTREKAYREVLERVNRKRKLDEHVHKLEVKKQLRGKGTRTKIIKRDKFGDEDPDRTYYKWKTERKK